VDWQWWEDESQQWHSYDVSINLQIEGAWGQCHSSSNAYFQASAPAGVSIRIHHQKYTVEFEADAVQKNLFSHYPRKVRRRLVSSGTGPGASAVAATVGPAATPSAPQASQSPHVVSVPAPSVPAGAVSLSYNESDLQPYVELSDDNDCPICVMNLREKNAVLLAKCRHVFCKDCIKRWFETRPTCPVCTMAYGVITGIQPNGTMSVRIIPVASPGFGSGLEGFPDVDIIQIHYNFPSCIQVSFLIFFTHHSCLSSMLSYYQHVSITPRSTISVEGGSTESRLYQFCLLRGLCEQGPEHPSPGRRYTGTRRVAYLPSTKEGEDVLCLLKTAWDRRLLFSVGTSITTGQRDVVT